MRKIQLFIAALMLILSSCTEDDFPKKFTQYEFINGKVRMFTKAGEVINDNEIEQFTERIRSYFLNSWNAPTYVYSFDDDKDLLDTYRLEIILTAEAEGTIRILSDNPNENQNMDFELIKKDNYCLISMQDTVVTYSYTENPRLKCTPEIIERIPVPGGRVIYLRPLYIIKENDELRLCIVSYMENGYFNDELTSISILGATNNLINGDYLSDLKTSGENRVDSIAYKESYIIFK